MQKVPNITPDTPLTTLTFTVTATPAEREKVFFSFQGNVLSIEFPKNADCESPAVQKIFWNGIIYFLRKEAQRILPPRLKLLADLHGFTYSACTVRASRSRWGSCAGRRGEAGQRISLSLFLMLVPQHLVDYVLLHELCHTRQMNHSPQFWALLDSVCEGKSKTLRKELRAFSIPR